MTPRQIRLRELINLAPTPYLRALKHWWLLRAERHFLMCADVEAQHEREARMNIAYYQKRAALARSERTTS